MRYRDFHGVERDKSTGCRDKTAAEQVARELMGRVERQRAGLISPDEEKVLQANSSAFSGVVEAYCLCLSKKRGKGERAHVSPSHVENVRYHLTRLADDMGIDILSKLTRDTVETWRDLQAEKGVLSARTINACLCAVSAMGTWLVKTNRDINNRFTHIDRLPESVNRRRVRRALSEEELRSLFSAAQRRPLAEQGRQSIHLLENKAHNKQSRRGTWTLEPITAETLHACVVRARKKLAPVSIAMLEQKGLERSTLYAVAFQTGLRRNELKSLVVDDLHLTAERPHLRLAGQYAKNGKTARIPLRADIIEMIKLLLAKRQALWKLKGEEAPSKQDRLFAVPSATAKVFRADCIAAGIAIVDDQGRTLDFHCLRVSTATHLNRNGVAPRTAQAIMRHSSLSLTMGTYTDEELLDTGAALDSLPELNLTDEKCGSHKRR